MAGEEIVGNIETGRYQEGGGSGDRGRLGLTLIPRSVDLLEVACWDQKRGVSRKESISFLRFWMFLGDCGLEPLLLP